MPTSRTVPSGTSTQRGTKSSSHSPSPPRAKSHSPSPTPSNPKAKSKSPSPEPATTYQVFLVEYLGNGERTHHSIFVETNEDGPRTGHIYHVEGTILTGMRYVSKRAKQPESSASFSTKHNIGTVCLTDYHRIDSLCQTVDPPARQMRLNGQKLYPNQPLRRCQEWTAETIALLKHERVVRS